MSNGYDPIVGTGGGKSSTDSFTLSVIDKKTTIPPGKQTTQAFKLKFTAIVQLQYDTTTSSWKVVLSSGSMPFDTDAVVGATIDVAADQQWEVKCEPDSAFKGPFPAMIAFTFEVSSTDRTKTTEGQYVVTRSE